MAGAWSRVLLGLSNLGGQQLCLVALLRFNGLLPSTP
jgi:hypothetical protein